MKYIFLLGLLSAAGLLMGYNDIPDGKPLLFQIGIQGTDGKIKPLTKEHFLQKGAAADTKYQLKVECWSSDIKDDYEHFYIMLLPTEKAGIYKEQYGRHRMAKEIQVRYLAVVIDYVKDSDFDSGDIIDIDSKGVYNLATPLEFKVVSFAKDQPIKLVLKEPELINVKFKVANKKGVVLKNFMCGLSMQPHGKPGYWGVSDETGSLELRIAKGTYKISIGGTTPYKSKTFERVLSDNDTVELILALHPAYDHKGPPYKALIGTLGIITAGLIGYIFFLRHKLKSRGGQR